MRRYTVRAVSALLPLLALLVLAVPAQGAMKWCKTDPIVRLDGRQVQILVAVPEEYVPLVNGPIDVEVKTPEGTAKELLFTDAGYNGHGEVVRFTGLDPEGQYQFVIRVPVDEARVADGFRLPVQVEVIEDGAEPLVVEGTGHGVSVAISTSGGGATGGGDGEEEED